LSEAKETFLLVFEKTGDVANSSVAGAKMFYAKTKMATLTKQIQSPGYPTEKQNKFSRHRAPIHSP
jgi:hypothetical protein